MLVSLAQHYGFDVETPFENAPGARPGGGARRLGRGEDRLPLPRRAGPAGGEASTPSRGSCPTSSGAYRETDSVAVKEELAKYLNTRACPDCGGTRLRLEARHVRVAGRTIHELSAMPLEGGAAVLRGPRARRQRGRRSPRRSCARSRTACRFLINVGLDYLSLTRSADTLSGGEAQRIRLASQIGSGLTGVMYVLDEPSIGLHQRDNARLIDTLKRLRDLGNSVIVVEHDEEAIHAADHVVDMGPGAGRARRRDRRGGHARRRSSAIRRRSPASTSRAARAIALPRAAPPARSRSAACASSGARGNNLKNVTRRHAGGPLRVRHRRLRARASPRSSTTRSTPRSRTTSTAPRPSPPSTRRSRASTTSTR